MEGKTLKTIHCVSLNPDYHTLGLKIARKYDLSFSGLVGRLIKEEAIRKGMLKEVEDHCLVG